MDYRSTFAISAAGMTVERARVEAAAMNLANANTVAAPSEAGYQPMHVVATAAGIASGPPTASFGEQVDGGLAALGAGGLTMPQFALEPAAEGPRLVYEPGHPLADAKGYVAHPAVDSAAEMVTLMSAMRAYEANVAAMNTARTLAQKTLEIGSGN